METMRKFFAPLKIGVGSERLNSDAATNSHASPSIQEPTRSFRRTISSWFFKPPEVEIPQPVSEEQQNGNTSWDMTEPSFWTSIGFSLMGKEPDEPPKETRQNVGSIAMNISSWLLNRNISPSHIIPEHISTEICPPCHIPFCDSFEPSFWAVQPSNIECGVPAEGIAMPWHTLVSQFTRKNLFGKESHLKHEIQQDMMEQPETVDESEPHSWTTWAKELNLNRVSQTNLQETFVGNFIDGIVSLFTTKKPEEVASLQETEPASHNQVEPDSHKAVEPALHKAVGPALHKEVEFNSYVKAASEAETPARDNDNSQEEEKKEEKTEEKDDQPTAPVDPQKVSPFEDEEVESQFDFWSYVAETDSSEWPKTAKEAYKTFDNGAQVSENDIIIPLIL